MCLDNLAKFNIKRYVGYKVFFKSNTGKLSGEFKALHKSREVNTWLNSSNFSKTVSLRLECDPSLKYPNGFHIYLLRNNAGENIFRDHIIKRVRFRKVVAKGFQYGCKVVVAKEIFIEE